MNFSYCVKASFLHATQIITMFQQPRICLYNQNKLNAKWLFISYQKGELLQNCVFYKQDIHRFEKSLHKYHISLTKTLLRLYKQTLVTKNYSMFSSETILLINVVLFMLLY